MEELYPEQVAQSISGGIYYADGKTDRTVFVCGANCPDKDEVTAQLRADGMTVKQNGCHGSIGGCAMNGTLKAGTYATVPEQTADSGSLHNEVIIRK